ncbi:MAG: hypothetical protein OEZ58_00865 [Gammaproteobacteria bacterium]|nr:hypothetical protein [Gammaproteobacteria bacterium]MDH5727526.1 hypothetical protein [Gammaproteobacteria bacterium]
MVGKKNIVFGFAFLIFTAALGPLMISMYEDWGAAFGEKQNHVGRLQQLKTDSFEEDLEALSADQIAKANTDGVLSLNKLINVETEIDMIKGGPHAHGNLEALLNIVVGLVLCFVSASLLVKQTISWVFIAGTVMHSGLLYLERVFGFTWLSGNPIMGIGPVLLLLGLLLMALVTFKSFEGRLQDR